MEGPGVFVSSSTESGRRETVEVIMGTASSSTVEADCKHVPEYVTAFEHRRAYWLWLEQERNRCTSEEEFLTAVANPTWTEVAPMTSNSAEGSTSSSMSLDDQRMIQVMNQQFFKELIKNQREYRGELNDVLFYYDELNRLSRKSQFFMDFGGRLALGKKIAQGGQAEIYEALFDGKKAVIQNDYFWFVSNKEVSLVLKDGRFAFLMRRYWGDLRKAINMQIVKDKTHLNPPFPPSISTHIMYQIGVGMNLLHEKGTLHRDLKATNVLVPEKFETSMRLFENNLRKSVLCEIADFESVEGVMGTRFWRAPEVLRIIRSRAEDIHRSNDMDREG